MRARAAAAAHTRFDFFLGSTERQHNRIAALTMEVMTLQSAAVLECRAARDARAASSLSAVCSAVDATPLLLTVATVQLDELVAEAGGEGVRLGIYEDKFARGRNCSAQPVCAPLLRRRQ